MLPGLTCHSSRNGGSELPTPILEQTDMEEMLDACLRTTAYLAVSRDHHKVSFACNALLGPNGSSRLELIAPSYSFLKRLEFGSDETTAAEEGYVLLQINRFSSPQEK